MVKGGMSSGTGSMGLTMSGGMGSMGGLGLKGGVGGGMKGGGVGGGTKDQGIGGGYGMSKKGGEAGGGMSMKLKGCLDGALSSLVDDVMRADGSDLSLEGHTHTKDLNILELTHLTDELVHLNRGGVGGGVGGRDMKEGR